MKLLYSISLMLLIAGIAIGPVSCKSDDDAKVDLPSCSDGIQNQGEEGVDCGGPCPKCEQMGMTAEIGGYKWVAKNIQTTYTGGKLKIVADNAVTPLWMICINKSVPAQTGTYTLDAQTTLNQMGSPYEFVSGTLAITKFDKDNKVVSGTFSMNFKDGYSIKVDKGKFTLLPYE